MEECRIFHALLELSRIYKTNIQILAHNNIFSTSSNKNNVCLIFDCILKTTAYNKKSQILAFTFTIGTLFIISLHIGVIFVQKATGARQIAIFMFALYSGFVDRRTNSVVVPIE